MKGSNTVGKISEGPSLLKNITMDEKSSHEYFSLCNNFIGLFIQQDKVKETKRETTKLSKQIEDKVS